MKNLYVVLLCFVSIDAFAQIRTIEKRMDGQVQSVDHRPAKRECRKKDEIDVTGAGVGAGIGGASGAALGRILFGRSGAVIGGLAGSAFGGAAGSENKVCVVIPASVSYVIRANGSDLEFVEESPTFIAQPGYVFNVFLYKDGSMGIRRK